MADESAEPTPKTRSFPKLSRGQALATVTAVALVTAGLEFGDSLLRYMTSDSSAEDSQASGKDGPTVVHNVQHRAGTQETDILTGNDDLTVTPSLLAQSPDIISADEYEDITNRYIKREFGDVECAPLDYRIHNATDNYVHLQIDILEPSFPTDDVSIAPGGRYLLENVAPSLLILRDAQYRFSEIIPIVDCEALAGN